MAVKTHKKMNSIDKQIIDLIQKFREDLEIIIDSDDFEAISVDVYCDATKIGSIAYDIIEKY